MSILIKGMEMPKEYGPHEITITLFVRDDGTASLWGKEVFIPHEPLEVVTVPPHGRLIDADTLVERIDGIWDCNDMVFKPNDKICKIPEDCKGCKWKQTKDCIQRMVENAPTIIPADEEKS